MRDKEIQSFEFGSGHPPTLLSTHVRSRRWIWVCALLVVGLGRALHIFITSSATLQNSC